MLVVLLSSCAHAFRDNVRKQAEKDILFVDVQNTIELNIGYTFIWGGTIANIVSSGEGSTIEVIQTPLNTNGKIIDLAVTEGRFIVFDPEKLDVSEYFIGQTLTVAGILTGVQTGTVDGIPYSYPKIETIATKLWGANHDFIPLGQKTETPSQ